MPLHDEKFFDFPLSYPPPPLLPPQTQGMGPIGQNSTFFPEQSQHKPTKTFVRGQHARIQIFFLLFFFFLGGGGGGPGSSTYFFGEELYKLHASVLILILLFQFVFTMYKLIWIKYV